MAQDAKADEINNLKKDLDDLKQTISNLTQAYKEDYAEKAGAAADQARESAGQAAGRVNQGVRDGARTVSDQVEAHPLTSLLLAFGVGMALGKTMTRH